MGRPPNPAARTRDEWMDWRQEVVIRRVMIIYCVLVMLEKRK